MRKAKVRDLEEEASAPFEQMVPETVYIEAFNKAWREWQPNKLRVRDSFGGIVRSPSSEVGRILMEAIGQNDADKVLSFFYADFCTEEDIYQIIDYKELEELRGWIVKWANSQDGYWNELLDRSAKMARLLEFKPKPVAKRWSKWAEGVARGEEGERLFEPIFKYKSKMPLSIVAQHIKSPSKDFLGRALKDLYEFRGALAEGLLERADIDQGACFEVVRDLLAEKPKKMEKFGKPDLLYQIARQKYWCPPEMGANLLERARVRDSKDLGYYAKRTVARYANGDLNFWQEAVVILRGNSGPDDRRILNEALENPGFPSKLAQELLGQGLAGESRKALAGNMELVKNPEVRLALEQSGQLVDIWVLLLKTSTDPVEASRLVSYLAKSNINLAVKALTKMKLPEGTTLPVTVLSKVMQAPKDREQRVAVIKRLPQVKPVNALPPDQPKRAKRRKPGFG